MKLFYLLTFSVLMGLFGTGCFEGSGGDPTEDAPEAGTYAIHSKVRATVEVSVDGQPTVSLVNEKCILVSSEQIDSLEIVVPSWFQSKQVLCSNKDREATPCNRVHVAVISGSDGDDEDTNPDKPILATLDDPQGCTKELGAEENQGDAAEEQSDGDEAGAAPTAGTAEQAVSTSSPSEEGEGGSADS